MKLKINKYIIALLLVTALMLPSSCSEDFLDVINPNVLSKEIYPTEINDFELLMNDLYGRLRDGYYSQYIRSMVLIDHGNDTGYNGAEFNEFCLNNLNPNLLRLRNWWENMYLHIAKCNDFLIILNKYKESATLTAEQTLRIEQMEAEARFLRAFNYFYLVNLFGEEPVITETDLNKMGVPLWIDLSNSISSTSKPRATQGEIYNLIISDLEAAVPLLEGDEKINNEEPRIDEWAVKSLLAKTYMFTLQWSKAVPVLKNIIDNSGKELVSYEILRNMFNGNNEYNKESIWEVNYTTDMEANSGSTITGHRYNNYVSITYINASGQETTNGFSNFFVHDANIPRFGFDDETGNIRNEPRGASYKSYSLKVRADKSVDPRLFVTGLQPYVDTVNLNDGSGLWYLITKGRMEAYNSNAMRAWNNRKYSLIDNVFVRNCGINFYVFRLADIYLMYAEALIESGGSQIEAVEYINKVHRRAYDQPVDIPSPYDYVTLNDRTVTLDPNDHLANDVLKYERWAELINEGCWWFDVRRWDIGEKEAAYYKKTNPGPLVWTRVGAYSFPIPTPEIDANSLMVQNP